MPLEGVIACAVAVPAVDATELVDHDPVTFPEGGSTSSPLLFTWIVTVVGVYGATASKKAFKTLGFTIAAPWK
jgi:hypothetical protein